MDEFPDARVLVLTHGGILVRPIAPAEWRSQRRRERQAERLRLFRFARLALVQNAKEKNPRQLRDLFHRPGAIRAAHHIADGFDGRIE